MGLISISDPINDAYGASEDENGNRTYTTEHIGYADSPNMSPWDVMTDPLVPQPHISIAPWDSFATARKRTPTPWEDDSTWFIKIDWSTARVEKDKDSDPLLRPVTGTRRCMDVEVPTFFDSRGFPIVNTAGSLIAGVTSVANVTIVDVEALFSSFPVALEQFNNTVNAAPVYIHGLLYPGRTCWCKNVRLSDVPEEEYGIEFYRAQYEIHIDPRGFWDLRPNTGMTYLEYQTRADADSAFKKTTYATYDAADPADRKIVEQRARGNDGMLLSEPVWLDRWGQRTKPTFPNAPIGTAAGTAGSKVITVTGGAFETDDVGVVLTLTWPSPKAQPVQLIVESVTSATVVNVHIAPSANFSGVDCTVSGALFKLLERQPAADWSTLPLPPVPPTL